MNLIHAIILAIVEGLTEFLPVSSTGHLVLASSLMHIQETEFVKSFELFIQVGAILAVVYVYWRKLLDNTKMWKQLIAAFIPTAVIGLLLYKVIKNVLLGNSLITVISLALGGLVIIYLEKKYQESDKHLERIEDLPLKNAVWIGVFQSLSIVPGVSRAAATILSGMYLGLKRKTAVEFSFLLAIPTIVAASGLDLVKTKFHFSGSEWMLLLVGLVVSFVVALFVIRWLIRFVSRNDFIGFGIYRIVIAVLFWLVVLRS